MTIKLPYENQHWPVHRILTKDTWAGNSGSWTIQPMWSKGVGKTGYEVLFYSRVCLPAVGEARIRYRFGKIDGRWVGLSSQPLGSWDATSDSIRVPDLRKKEIRIQAGELSAGSTEPDQWRTVWWGQCEFQEVTGWGGSDVPAGEVIYHCSDGLYRTKRWPLNHHGFYISDSALQSSLAYGHPGYNALDHNGIQRGNKNASATFDPTAGDNTSGGDGLHNVMSHTWPGAGTIWTDQEAVEHALNVARPRNEPVFLLSGSTTYYSQSNGNAWDVKDDDSAWDFLTRVCRRQRGLGCAFLDWTDDIGNPLGAMTVMITVSPQTKANITFKQPVPNTLSSTWSTTTLPGSDTAGTSLTVDLIGDHRLVADSFTLGDRDQHRVDYLESVGEQIEVLATLSGFDNVGGVATLGKRWVAAQEVAFNLLDSQHRVDDAWRPVYQLYGVPRSFAGKAGDHNGGKSVAIHRIDFRCLDNGDIIAPGASAANAPPSNRIDTSPMLIEVLPDLPLLEGYEYKAYPPVRKDGLAETGLPPRRPPIVLIRLDDDFYRTGEQSVNPLTINVSKDGILIHSPSDLSDAGAYRTVGDTTKSGLGSFYNFNQIGCTVGLRMPHRVRFATYGTDANGTTLTSQSVRRRLTITHNGLHLWVASAGAIWDVDAARLSSRGIPGKRTACGGSADSPGILRDDRGALAVRHALACAWYLQQRRTAQWSLKACGFLPSFVNVTDFSTNSRTTVTYPTLGKVVTSIAANGQVNDVNTPITSITYDNQSGTTTWATDWAELDFVS
jgi:hypothetical protein